MDDRSVYDYTRMFEEARQVDETSFLASILRKVYGWMAIGLALSGVIAWYHHRMPVVLRREDVALWILDDRSTGRLMREEIPLAAVEA